jgi:hypothetical protein
VTIVHRKIALRDIKDVEAFVIACVKRAGTGAPPMYWEDLVSEGITLLYAMERNYKYQLDGYAVEGRFSGYAIKWLPKQINQAWHKSQEHHLYLTDPGDGKRKWTYRISPVSYEVAVLSGDLESESMQEVRMLGINQFVEVPVYEE